MSVIHSKKNLKKTYLEKMDLKKTLMKGLLTVISSILFLIVPWLKVEIILAFTSLILTKLLEVK
jgi:hypothetical protein